MASRYEFTEEQIEELTKAAKENKKKDVDKRLRTLLMRANGKKLSEIATATGYSFSGIVKLVSKYRQGGLAAIAENHYGGNHRNVSNCIDTYRALKPLEILGSCRIIDRLCV